MPLAATASASLGTPASTPHAALALAAPSGAPPAAAAAELDSVKPRERPPSVGPAWRSMGRPLLMLASSRSRSLRMVEAAA
jgi:hypothetical protein